MAIEIYNNTIKQPNEAPTQKALIKLDQETQQKVSNLFRNTHALMKHNKSFEDYVWLCDLDGKKGLNIGKIQRQQKFLFIHSWKWMQSFVRSILPRLLPSQWME